MKNRIGIAGGGHLGRRHFLRLDQAVEIFNSSAKALALRKTLEALQGENPGEGEALLSEFKGLANRLGIDCVKKTTCHEVFQQVCSYFGPDTPQESFHPLWKLVSRYFGSETPVARVIRERAKVGLPTTLLTTQEVYNVVHS